MGVKRRYKRKPPTMRSPERTKEWREQQRKKAIAEAAAAAAARAALDAPDVAPGQAVPFAPGEKSFDPDPKPPRKPE
jgi:hypothetical protein